MKKIHILPIVIFAAVFIGFRRNDRPRHSSDAEATRVGQTVTAFSKRDNGAHITGEGVVTKLLSDDNHGNRHQRFVLRLASGQTLLVAHNIDLAPRLSAIKVGDVVEFSGVYQWNPKGGLVHWTHHDPSGHHPVAGWLKLDGQTYK